MKIKSILTIAATICVSSVAFASSSINDLQNTTIRALANQQELYVFSMDQVDQYAWEWDGSENIFVAQSQMFNRNAFDPNFVFNADDRPDITLANATVKSLDQLFQISLSGVAVGIKVQDKQGVDHYLPCLKKSGYSYALNPIASTTRGSTIDVTINGYAVYNGMNYPLCAIALEGKQNK